MHIFDWNDFLLCSTHKKRSLFVISKHFLCKLKSEFKVFHPCLLNQTKASAIFTFNDSLISALRMKWNNHIVAHNIIIQHWWLQTRRAIIWIESHTSKGINTIWSRRTRCSIEIKQSKYTSCTYQNSTWCWSASEFKRVQHTCCFLRVGPKFKVSRLTDGEGIEFSLGSSRER